MCSWIFLSDVVSYEFRYNWHNLVYILLIAIAAAVFSNFSGAFRNRQISDISFYVLYMLLITLCLTAFQTAAQGLEGRLDSVVEFMRVLCPSYFLAVAFASGSVTSVFFYNVILLLIYVVELVIIRFVLPVIHIYIMIRVLGNLTGEDFLSESAELMHKVVGVDPEDTAGVCDRGECRTGAPGSCYRYAEKKRSYQDCGSAALGGKCDGRSRGIFLGTAVLIKNGIGDGRGSHCGPHLSRPDRTAGADGIDV